MEKFERVIKIVRGKKIVGIFSRLRELEYSLAVEVCLEFWRFKSVVLAVDFFDYHE